MPFVERAEIKLYCHPKLKKRLESMADKKGLNLTQFIVWQLAHLAKAPIWGIVPKNKTGRGNKKETAPKK